MKDVYPGVKEVPLLGSVLIGHFKGPFSMEELTSSRHITFMERALPNYFVAGREVGVAAYNRSAGERILWGFGVFADGVPETTKQLVDRNIGTQLIGRVTWNPYYDEPSDGRYLLHLGGGVRHVQDRNGLYTLRVRPETHESIRVIDMDGDNDRANHYTVYDAELAWVHGPFSIQTEGFVNVVDVVGVGNTRR
jgi:phosphate-selective porin OprO/OprP